MKQKDKDELLELSRKALDSYIKKTYVKGDKPYKRAEGRKIAQKKEYDKAQSGKGWKEEVEQIDELSKETLKKYIPVADRQGLRARNSETINKQTGHGSDWDTKEYGKMADKREKGVKAALRKVYRKNQLGEDVLEEVEQIDELSKKTQRNKGIATATHKLAGTKQKPSMEEVTMEYNEETGHIALVNAIFDGNRDEANEIFDTVLSGRINPVVSAKKEELAKTMFAPHEEVTEEYEPLPLTEEAEHGHHHRVHASLTDRKNDLSNEAHNGFMSGNLTKEHKKEVLKHVKAAEGRLDSAKAKLGSAESADHLNAAAVHITDGGLHLQNVRTYTSLGFRGY